MLRKAMNSASFSSRAPHRLLGGAVPALVLCLLARASVLRADAVLEEVYQLAQGWNLIKVPVEPLASDPRDALSSINWESLWTWLSETGDARGGRWLVFHRDAPAFLNTLGSFTGPRSYLLFAPSGGTLRVRGFWRPERPALQGGAYQLFGPSLRGVGQQSLSSYFSRPGVAEHIGQVFELAAGAYRRLAAADLLRAGAAYWVLPSRDIAAPDPVRVAAGFGGVRFDSQTALDEIEVDIGAAGGAGGGADGGGAVVLRQLRLRAIPSADAAAPADWLELQKEDGTFAALPSGGDPAIIDVDSQATRVRIGVRARHETEAVTSDRSAVIEVAGTAGSALVGADLIAPTLQGMWIGEAVVSAVEQPSFYGGGSAPAPAMSVSLILEVPSAGRPRLLPCIALEGERDGRKLTRRMEAALFHGAVELAGSVGAGGSGTLSGGIDMAADHPLNPYRHRYHPEHRLGYELARDVRLRFGAKGTEPELENPLATVGVLSGVYEEEIHGLSREVIRVRGTFQLRRLAGGNPMPCATAGQ
jgi:hypothetical protein